MAVLIKLDKSGPLTDFDTQSIRIAPEDRIKIIYCLKDEIYLYIHSIKKIYGPYKIDKIGKNNVKISPIANYRRGINLDSIPEIDINFKKKKSALHKLNNYQSEIIRNRLAEINQQNPLSNILELSLTGKSMSYRYLESNMPVNIIETRKSFDMQKISDLLAPYRRLYSKFEKAAFPLQTATELEKFGFILYCQIFGNTILNEKLLSHKNKDLIIKYDKSLDLIPWELLYNGTDFFCFYYNLGRYVRSCRTFINRPYLKKTLNFALLSCADSNLPGLKKEAEEIKKLYYSFHGKFGNFYMINKKLNYAGILELFNSFDIVHFAGHGYYRGKTPGWKISEKKFFPFSELKNIKTATSLLFSNTCTPSRINFAEPVSIIQNAGINNFITTLSNIPDKNCHKLSAEFYSQLLSGKSIGNSLKIARKKLYTSDNIEWAYYLLFGDPKLKYF